MRTIAFDSLSDRVGEELAVSEWVLIDQARINLFADATDDHQWIHVDAAKAAIGPFGKTIAHGFLTLSLIPHLFQRAMTIEGSLAINYGLESVRFPHPVPVDSRVRARFTLQSLKALPPLNGRAGVQIVVEVKIEADGIAKPVCVAQQITRRYA